MRNFILNITILFEVANAMTGSEIVPVSFVSTGVESLRTNIEKAISDVEHGAATAELAIMSVKGGCIDFLSSFRNRINKEYNKRLEAYRINEQNAVKKLIASKNQEIQNLRTRIDNIFNSSSELSEVFKVRNEQRAEIEEELVSICNTALAVPCEELITGRHLDSIMSRFVKDLNYIRGEFESGQRNLENAFSRSKERYRDHLDDFIISLQDRYEDIISRQNERYSEDVARLESAYNRKISILQRMLDEAQVFYRNLERKHALVMRLNKIIKGKNLDLKKINPLSTSFQSVDILKKREIASSLYKKFTPFVELLNEDFILVAAPKDFKALKNYLNITPINKNPKAPMEMPVCTPCSLGRGNEIEWNQGGDNGAWINPKMQLWLKEMGVYDFPDWYDNSRGENSWGTQQYCWNWRPRAVKEYNKRKALYDKEVANRNAQIEHAKKVPFPLEAFNRLVRQFNTFISQL